MAQKLQQAATLGQVSGHVGPCPGTERSVFGTVLHCGADAAAAALVVARRAAPADPRPHSSRPVSNNRIAAICVFELGSGGVSALTSHTGLAALTSHAAQTSHPASDSAPPAAPISQVIMESVFGRIGRATLIRSFGSGLFHQWVAPHYPGWKVTTAVGFCREVVAMPPPLAGAPGAAGSGQELTVPPGRSRHAVLKKITARSRP